MGWEIHNSICEKTYLTDGTYRFYKGTQWPRKHTIMKAITARNDSMHNYTQHLSGLIGKYLTEI